MVQLQSLFLIGERYFVSIRKIFLEIPMSRLSSVLILACGVAVAGSAFAGGHAGNPAVTARKAHMQLYSFNLGTLGAMAVDSGSFEVVNGTLVIAADSLGLDAAAVAPDTNAHVVVHDPFEAYKDLFHGDFSLYIQETRGQPAVRYCL